MQLQNWNLFAAAKPKPGDFDTILILDEGMEAILILDEGIEAILFSGEVPARTTPQGQPTRLKRVV